MSNQQLIKDCIKSCQDVIGKFESMSQDTNDQRLKSTLEESRHHLEMCMYECEWAGQEAP